MALSECTAVIYDNGEFIRIGIDHPKSAVVKRTNEVIVVKQDGGTYWRGIGMGRGRAGAEFQVWSILSGEGDRVKVKLLVDFPVRKVVAT